MLDHKLLWQINIKNLAMKNNKNRLTLFVLIFGISAIAYLPLVTKFCYTFDDWYLMWAAKAYGSETFFPIFSVDRPLRAWLMYPAYQLFGENPLWYNLSAYLFRVLGGLAFGWMLGMLWPRARTAAISMVLLFVIYPGFLSQPNAIDYQSHIVALALALFSLALTVRAFIGTGSMRKRAPWLVVSALTGWLYLGLMEYYIGFEIIRFLLIFLLATRAETTWMVRIKKAVLGWLPLSIIPVGFVFWRVFIFVGERKATNAGAQLFLFLVSPLRAMYNWTTGLIFDTWDVLVMAWVTPLAQMLKFLNGTQILSGIGLGLLAILATWYTLRSLKDDEVGNWRREALWLGLGSVFAGLIPVILANREVSFPYFSRYTLISSAGAVMFLVALVSSLPRKAWQQAVFSTLILVAMLTHFANSVKFAAETASMKNFWWQVAWRIPHLEQSVTLVTLYPTAPLQEDYFIWGPANLIYYPVPLSEKDIQPGIFAAMPDADTVEKVLARERQQYDNRRKIITYANYRNILLLIQNQETDCVRVIDGQLPEVWQEDSEAFLQMAPFSEIDHVWTDMPENVPPSIVFGPEPEHGWCYYYQKASLARQKGDWEEARRLGDEASAKNVFYTATEIEWLPFIQAYALAGDTDKVTEIASHFRKRLDETGCQALAHPQIPEDARTALERQFCQQP